MKTSVRKRPFGAGQSVSARDMHCGCTKLSMLNPATLWMECQGRGPAPPIGLTGLVTRTRRPHSCEHGFRVQVSCKNTTIFWTDKGFPEELCQRETKKACLMLGMPFLMWYFVV